MVDWEKVERDYAHSSFDRKRLNLYATKVAGRLLSASVPFDGNTVRSLSSEGPLYSEEVQEVPNGFLRNLFGAKTKRRVARKGLGFWVLQSSRWSGRHTDRKKTRYKNLSGPGSFSVQHRHHWRGEKDWILLQDGRLAIHTEVHSGMYDRDTDNSDLWALMSDADVLLLDHKVRSHDRHYNDRSGHGFSIGSTISSDNYLVTGKKGGGCSKKLTDLLRKHGLYEKPQPKRAPAPHRSDQPLLTKTYSLTRAQLVSGASVEHVFRNGTRTTVRINPNTPSGKVITVRTKQSGEAERIKLIQGGFDE